VRDRHVHDQQRAGDGAAHERFVAWLRDPSGQEPSRDVALHAYVCPACARWIAASDALESIDPGRAPLPSSRPAPAPLSRGLRRAGGMAAVAGGLTLAAAVAGFGLAQLASGPLGLFTDRTGAVLGATGSPARTPGAVGGGTPPPGSVELGGIGGEVGPSPTPTPTPVPTRRPAATTAPVAVTPRPTATPHATPPPTPMPSVTSTPSPTPIPTPTATPTPTAVPTPSPTPEPTPTAPPTVAPTPTPTPTPAPPAPSPSV